MSALNILHHSSLKTFNSFGIDVMADSFCEIRTVNELRQTVDEGLFNFRFLILGGGTNILFTENYQGIVFQNLLKGIEITEEDETHVLITAAGGEIWHDLVMFAVKRNLGGIENLSLIPGTVGAAPIQNIGAYGVELTNVFHSLNAVQISTGEEKIFSKEDCKFGYRNSIFKNEEKGNYFITSITLRLTKNPVVNISYGAIKSVLEKNGISNPSVKDVSDAVIFIRRSKLPDPAVLGNAGSFFKNPEIPSAQYEELKTQFPDMAGFPAHDTLIKVPAGWLIEQCGWKGKRVGNTGAHKDQALVLVNYGNATGNEIYALAMNIKSSVKEKFGIDISPEVNLI